MQEITKRTVVLVLAAIFSITACLDLKIVATELPREYSSETEPIHTDTKTDYDSDTIRDYDSDTKKDSDSETGTGVESNVCQELFAVPGKYTRTVQAGASLRTYILYIPDSYTGTNPSPLIIDYHPISSDGEKQHASSPYPAITDSEGVVMAFPDGMSGPIGTAWNMGPCCVDEADDVAFARAIVQDVTATACIDSSRVYAIGTSMGGGMAHYLACKASDIFAAAAPSAFDLVEEIIDECVPVRPISIISFRGTADPLVPYEGGYSSVVPSHPVTFLGAEKTLEKWAEINGCTGPITDVGNGCRGFPSTQCPGGIEIILCTKEGGGIEAGDPKIAWPILKRQPKP